MLCSIISVFLFGNFIMHMLDVPHGLLYLSFSLVILFNSFLNFHTICLNFLISVLYVFWTPFSFTSFSVMVLFYFFLPLLFWASLIFFISFFCLTILSLNSRSSVLCSSLIEAIASWRWKIHGEMHVHGFHLLDGAVFFWWVVIYLFSKHRVPALAVTLPSWSLHSRSTDDK